MVRLLKEVLQIHFIVVDMPIGTVGLSDEEDLKMHLSFIKTRMLTLSK